MTRPATSPLSSASDRPLFAVAQPMCISVPPFGVSTKLTRPVELSHVLYCRWTSSCSYPAECVSRGDGARQMRPTVALPPRPPPRRGRTTGRQRPAAARCCGYLFDSRPGEPVSPNALQLVTPAAACGQRRRRRAPRVVGARTSTAAARPPRGGQLSAYGNVGRWRCRPRFFPGAATLAEGRRQTARATRWWPTA